MSQKAYEDACMRAELFGQPKPDKIEFIEKHRHLDEVPFEDIDIGASTSAQTAMLDGDLKATGRGLNELNTILSSTQTKLNRLKGACGSLTSFFRAKLTAKDDLSYSSDPSYVGQTNFDRASTPQPTRAVTNLKSLSPNEKEKSASAGLLAGKSTDQDGDINTALSDLKTMQQNTDNTLLVSKPMIKDMTQQVNTQVSKLDSLISKADRAESSLQHQNRQMRSFKK